MMTAAPSAFAPGYVIGDDFVVSGPLKQGGMGAVYAAEQRSTGSSIRA